MKPEVIKTKIVGVTKKNSDGRSRQKIIIRYVGAGTQLVLGREPDNEYDPFAVSVWYPKRRLFGKKLLQLGYLSANRAEEIAPMLDKKWRYSCVVQDVTGGTRQKKTRGVNIRIELLPPV